jgi:hypothetical protein
MGLHLGSGMHIAGGFWRRGVCVFFVRLIVLDLHGARRYLRFGWNTRMDDTAAQGSYSEARSTDRTLLVASSLIAIGAAQTA